MIMYSSTKGINRSEEIDSDGVRPIRDEELCDPSSELRDRYYSGCGEIVDNVAAVWVPSLCEWNAGLRMSDGQYYFATAETRYEAVRKCVRNFIDGKPCPFD